MAAKDDLGRAGESRAATYLTDLGFEIVDRNWRSRRGELDLVVRDAETIVVVEVKTRSDDAFGDPLFAVDRRKYDRLWRLALAWRQDHPVSVIGRRLRVDLIGITGPDPRTGRLDHLEDVC
ncbi:MAG: YraN family protein [Microbacterium sp.]|uniref:YraN family protein n=1 Tax=Microbacterium sp. TaxID=51671 RepID=UPI001AC89D1F|nr:YraN family protein [Microbacterium sp.]MBN9152903.1 YraN family protein [Microbacterium sp.]MBN9175621.1 YraN family protein [Microbacterium sp.]MBN9181940.1 YraN family protein [Microbacterium sp.]MBN9187277.1 YraN family protein [Microbacterium sp.]